MGFSSERQYEIVGGGVETYTYECGPLGIRIYEERPDVWRWSVTYPDGSFACGPEKSTWYPSQCAAFGPAWDAAEKTCKAMGL